MTTKKDIIKEYNGLKTKYPNLPKFEFLDKEFEISDMLTERNELPSRMIQTIRRRIVDIIGGWINYLHNFLLPNQQSMILVHEAENISQEERDHITTLVNQLMFMSRESAHLELTRSDNDDAEFIASHVEKWLIIKKDILSITEKNIAIWTEAINKKVAEEEKKQYIG